MAYRSHSISKIEFRVRFEFVAGKKLEHYLIMTRANRLTGVLLVDQAPLLEGLCYCIPCSSGRKQNKEGKTKEATL